MNLIWCRFLLAFAVVANLATKAAGGSLDAARETSLSAQAKACKAETGAKALQGRTPPEWQTERWLNSAPLQLADLRGKVVLVRWWTAHCRYCSTTAPALRGLHKRYSSQGLVVIGMYHHKEKDPFDPSIYEATAKDYGFKFPLAVDPEWRTFYRWMRDRQGNPVETGWTSVTFVLDKKGIVRHVHPGGSYVKGDAAYRELTSVLERLLAEG